MSDTVRRNRDYPSGYVRNFCKCGRVRKPAKSYDRPGGVIRFICWKDTNSFLRVKRLNCNLTSKY